MHKSQSPLDLAQIFEPVRDDLARVDQEFLKHVQSRVQLIPQIGKYLQTSGGKRIRPATLLMASRMAGYDGAGDKAVVYASVVEFIHTATLVHDDIIDESGDAPRPRRRPLALGHRHHGAARRLPVHQVDGPGADAGLARDRPAAVRRHAADDRRRALSAHQDRRRRHHRRRALRHHPAQDRPPVRRLRADRRHARRDHAGAAGGAVGVRLQPGHRLPGGRRSARLHGRRARARQADRERPARRQGHPADHLSARAGRRGARHRRRDRPRSRRDPRALEPS